MFRNRIYLLGPIKLVGVMCVVCLSHGVAADLSTTTRITNPERHARKEGGRYPHRQHVEAILEEIDIREGDVVVDIGAGDGWWSERIAPCVGAEGIVHSAEVEQAKVDGMMEKFSGFEQIKPYLCPKDGVALPENSCDLAFFSQVYHHLDQGGRVRYLEGLRDAVKTEGRLVVIEKYTGINIARGDHGTALSLLIQEAEEAGWIPLRIQLLTGAYHYLAIFAQKNLFPLEPERRSNRRRQEGRSETSEEAGN